MTLFKNCLFVLQVVFFIYTYNPKPFQSKKEKKNYVLEKLVPLEINRWERFVRMVRVWRDNVRDSGWRCHAEFTFRYRGVGRTVQRLTLRRPESIGSDSCKSHVFVYVRIHFPLSSFFFKISKVEVAKSDWLLPIPITLKKWSLFTS